MENIGIIDAKETLDKITKAHIVKQNTFHSYCPFYVYTTEDIKSSLSTTNYNENDKILTVMASGDHLLNYLLQGARDIDTFDINKVTKYYFELKKAWICSFNYDEYLDMEDSRVPFSLNYLEKFSKYMTDEAYNFWKYCKENASVDELGALKRKNAYQHLGPFNLYFNKKNYEKLQLILKEGVSFKFYHNDIFSLPEELTKEYKEIHVSNMFDYLSPTSDKVNEACSKLSPLLEEDGRILFYGYGPNDKEFDKTETTRKKINSTVYNYFYYKKH